MAQAVAMEKGGKLDWPRVARGGVFGSVFLGPLSHYHFNFLDWLVVKKVIFLFYRISVKFLTYYPVGVHRDEDGSSEDLYKPVHLLGHWYEHHIPLQVSPQTCTQTLCV